MGNCNSMATTKPWPADAVERRAVASLVPYGKNARVHSPQQVAQIAASITEWGFTNPVLVDDKGVLIAGHGRLEAARSLGLVDVPVMVATGWTKAQINAYRFADNKLAMNATWDDTALAFVLGDLKLDGFDLSLTGFSVGELAGLMDQAEGLTDPDDVPDAPAVPVTVLGDVWLLGRHRLMCGDSTDALSVATLMQGAQADLCFTSPPYAQQRDYKAAVTDWDALMQGVFSILPVTHEAQVLVNLGMVHRDGEWMPYWDGWIEWMRTVGWRRFGWYVWDQGPGMPGDHNGRLASAFEFIFHFNRVAEQARKTKAKLAASLAVVHGTGQRNADGRPQGKFNSPQAGLQPLKVGDSVIRVMRHKARGIETAHPAVFPVDLVSEMLTAFSDPDDIVYEPFCGSGTQLISAQKNGRTCLAMEIAPEYADVSVKRWQAFTGQSAVNERTGQNFADG